MNYVEELISDVIPKHRNINIECNSQESQIIYHSLKENNYIAIVFSDSDLYGAMKVKDYIKMFAKIFRSNELVEEVINVMQLEEYLNVRCKILSFSVQKRVSIARELLKKTNMMYIQEPLMNVDETSMRVILKWLAQNKRLIVITTSRSLKDTLLLPGGGFVLEEDKLQQIQIDDYSKVVNQETTQFTKISAKVEDKMILIDPNDIYYAEAQNSKCIIYVRNSTFQCQSTLEELENKLKRFGFYRCHRSYLINMQKVDEVIKWSKNSYSLKLRHMDAIHVPLSKGRVEDMMETYHL